MEKKNYIIIILIILLFVALLFTKEILNLILNMHFIKSYLVEKINPIKKNIRFDDKEKKINFMLTLYYNIRIYTNDLKEDDFFIHFETLNKLIINVKNVKCCIFIKAYAGVSQSISLGDDFDLCLEEKEFEYIIDVLYYPLKIDINGLFYSFLYDIDSQKIVLGFLVKIGSSVFKETIKNELTNYLFEIPNHFKSIIQKIENKYETVFKGIQLYNSFYNKIICFINDNLYIIKTYFNNLQ